jgi:hypothetical protein
VPPHPGVAARHGAVRSTGAVQARCPNRALRGGVRWPEVARGATQSEGSAVIMRIALPRVREVGRDCASFARPEDSDA